MKEDMRKVRIEWEKKCEEIERDLEIKYRE